MAERTDRRLLSAGVIILTVAALTFGAIGLITSDNAWYGAAISAIVAAGVPAVQLLVAKPRLELAVGWAALVIAVSQGIVNVPEARPLSGVSLVVLGVAAATFLHRRLQLIAGGVWAVALVGLSVWWDPDGGLAFGLGLAGGLVFMLWIQLELQAAYRRSQRARLRSDALVSRSLVPILDFDFSPIAPELAELHSRHGDLEVALRSDRDLLDDLFSRVRVRDMNAAAEADLAANGVEFPAPAWTGVHPSNRDAGSSWLAAIGRGERQWDGVIWLSGPGEVGAWYRVRHIIPDDETRDLSRTIVTGMNITELKEAQARLSTLDQAKNEFIATIAHEMRNPLAGVVGFSSELSNNLDLYEPEVIREMATLINRQSAEISYILDDLMAAASAEMAALKIVREPFDVGLLVRGVVETTGSKLEASDATGTYAVADPVRTRQIIRNLVTNADRYGGPNRRIEVTSVGRRLRISVIDDGPGLTDERVAQIFGSFGHVASSGVEGSMGLGLNVSRMLADLMGTKLVYERFGSETHFSIDLDLADVSDVASGDA